MYESVITLGTITIRQRAEESYENYTISNKKSIGRIIPFHVTGDQVDLRIGYALFINGERDIRTLGVQKDFNTFGRLSHGLRLAILPVPGDSRKLYAELKQAYPKESFTRHETLHPTLSEIDLDQGAGLSVFAELRKVGAEVGTKKELLTDSAIRSSYLCARFSKDNLWAPILAYVATRILPIANRYNGS
ncbi:MAG: hypothetical protein ABSA01_09985 [Anaerolineales bacterium]|jgi:hypothetical protein